MPNLPKPIYSTTEPVEISSTFLQTDIPGYVVDSKTGAVINRNKTELEFYKLTIQSLKEKDEREKEMSDMKKEVEDMKALMRALINKGIDL